MTGKLKEQKQEAQKYNGWKKRLGNFHKIAKTPKSWKICMKSRHIRGSFQVVLHLPIEDLEGEIEKEVKDRQTCTPTF